VVSVKGKTQQFDVLLGPNYRSIVLYSPNPAAARGGGGSGRGRGQVPAEGAAAPASGAGIPLTGAPNTAPNRGFIAIEPMAGITNSMNLAHKGLYKELQSVAPGRTWQESFWLRPSRF
jgi:galactose mutarotase-like enzyme